MVITETLSGHESLCTTAKSGQADMEPELHQRKANGGITGNKQKTAQLSSAAQPRREITYALFETDIDSIEEEKEEEEIEKEAEAEKGVTTASESPKQTRSVMKSISSFISGLIPTRKYEYVWLNIFGMVGLHVGAAVGYLLVPQAQVATLLWAYLLLLLGTLGVQAGAHRLWCHKAYKANFGVRLFLCASQTLALQNDIHEWSRDHRAHHKFADTDGDPHDSSKGFFFSHVGWLLVKKDPEVKRRGATLDLSDILADPIVAFQKDYYIPLVALFWGAIPTFVPVLCWGEDFVVAASVCVFARYVTSLNLTWCVNSWAHIYGNRPYDQKLQAVEASIRHLLMGEGFHNYHHAFPWDYSASELGIESFNPATAVIDFFHYMGWAWDLKKVRPEMIDAKKRKAGDPAFYHKRNTTLYEWTTGMATMTMPLQAMFAAKMIFA